MFFLCHFRKMKVGLIGSTHIDGSNGNLDNDQEEDLIMMKKLTDGELQSMSLANVW